MNCLNLFGIVTNKQKKQSETLQKKCEAAERSYRDMMSAKVSSQEVEKARQEWLQAKKESVLYSGGLRNIEISRRQRITYFVASAVVLAFCGCAWGAYRAYRDEQVRKKAAIQMYLLKSSTLERTK